MRMRLRLRRLSSPVAMPVITDLSSCKSTLERIALGGWQLPQAGDTYSVMGTLLPAFGRTATAGTLVLGTLLLTWGHQCWGTTPGDNAANPRRPG